MTPPAPAPVTVPVASNTNRAIKIMALGDSITMGQEGSPGGFRSYRGPLQQMLAAAGYVADFVGSLALTPSTGGDPHHEGYPGITIGPGPTDYNLFQRLPAILHGGVNPDVIIVAFGWNSVNWSPADPGIEYQNFVNTVRQMKPNAKVILGTLAPLQGMTESQTIASLPRYKRLNDTARGMAYASSNDPVYLADLAASGFTASDYTDKLHWQMSGAQKAAGAIYRAIVGSGAFSGH